MPLEYSIDPSRKLVIISGEYAAADEWMDLLGRLLADPRRQPGFAFLRDLREGTTPVDTATVLRVMEVVRRFWPQLQPCRAAILTRHDVDSPALVAVALADAEKLPLRLFTSLDEAMQWLTRGE